MGSFVHNAETDMVCKSINPKIPYFNAPIFLENKSQIGKVDEILGPIGEVFFTVKLQDGIVATSFKSGDKVFIAPDKLLPMERFLPKPVAPGSGKYFIAIQFICLTVLSYLSIHFYQAASEPVCKVKLSSVVVEEVPVVVAELLVVVEAASVVTVVAQEVASAEAAAAASVEVAAAVSPEAEVEDVKHLATHLIVISYTASSLPSHHHLVDLLHVHSHNTQPNAWNSVKIKIFSMVYHYDPRIKPSPCSSRFAFHFGTPL